MPDPSSSTPPEHPAGPDAIWAPWRLRYIESLDVEPADKPAAESGDKGDKASAGNTPPAPTSCFLAEYWASPEKDAEHHVLHRTGAGMILLNGYPYANGHLLVALGEGRPRLLDYSPEQRAELWSLVDLAMDLVERALEPQGVNVGLNQGRAAGAGLPGHLHVHLVPRWSGDVNFITTVGQIRVVPSSLQAMAERYRKTLGSMTR